MTDRTPLKGVFDAGKSIGLAEFVSGDTVAIAAGGTGKTTAATARTALGARHAKNYIINGGMRVCQRGDITVTNNFLKYGGPDRFLFTPWGWTTATGVISQRDQSLAQSGKMLQVFGITTTGTGGIAIATRLEAVDTKELKDKKFTVSAWVSHDFGSSTDLVWSVSRPDVADTFSTATTLGATTVSVPSGTPTLLSLTIDGSAGDLTKGIQIAMYPGIGAVTNKLVNTWDWQLVEGESRITLDLHPFGDELARCQRYYQKLHVGWVGAGTNAGKSYGGIFNFITQMRTIPSVVSYLFGSAAEFKTGIPDFYGFYSDLVSMYAHQTSQSVGGSLQYWDGTFLLEAEL